MSRTIVTVGLILLGISFARLEATESQCYIPDYLEFAPDDAASNALFGVSIDTDGDLAIIGASKDVTNGVQSGAAYIYQKSGGEWQQIARLTPSTPTDNQNFGMDVAIDGDTAVVVSRLILPSVTGRFAAYVFRNTGGNWQQIAMLSNSMGVADEFANIGVAIHGDTIAVGCPKAGRKGAVFLFREVGEFWLPTVVPSPEPEDGEIGFGASVVVEDDRLLVGAPAATNADGDRPGAVYEFYRNLDATILGQKLLADDPATSPYFGASLALENDTLVIGATYTGTASYPLGAAYVFNRSGSQWHQTARLEPDADLHAASFGRHVSISGNLIAVGASRAFGEYNPAFLYRYSDGWQNAGSFAPADGLTYSQSATTVALSGETLLAGVADGRAGTTHTGAVYALDLAPLATDCNANGIPDLCDIQTTSTDCNGNGIPDECDIASQTSSDCNGDGYPDECSNIVYTEVASFSSTDMTSGQAFGSSVDINGDIAVVGALNDNEFGTHSGAAYIFQKIGDNWEQVRRLVASDAAEGDRFGYSVSISGTAAIVGAYGKDDAGPDSGAAYVFEDAGDGWQQVARLTPSDAAASQDFGNSVSIHGDTAIVGAYGDSEFGEDAGAVYVFRRLDGDWEETAKLTADGYVTHDFGYCVSYDGDTLVVGSPFGQDSTTNAVYVFRNIGGSWTQVARLTPELPSAFGYFGSRAVVDGNTIAATAAYPGSVTPYRESVVPVFEKTSGTWQQTGLLTRPDDDPPNTTFGQSLDVSDDIIVVGSSIDILVGSVGDSGPVYAFRKSNGNWQPYLTLATESTATTNFFGGSAAIEGNRVLIGAMNEPQVSPHGAVYEFDLFTSGAHGDLDDDGDVDFEDLSIFVDVLLGADDDPVHVAEADTNCSGTVDGRDLQAFINLLLD